MAMARLLSVTVSIAAETNGIPSITSRVSRVRRIRLGRKYTRGGRHQQNVIERQPFGDAHAISA